MRLTMRQKLLIGLGINVLLIGIVTVSAYINHQRSIPVEQTAHQAERLTTIVIIAGGGGAIIVAIILGLLLSRSLMHPVTDLIAGLRRMASGDLTHRIPITTDDEIGMITCEVNAMAEELNTSHGELLIAHQKLHEAYNELVQADKMASLGMMAGTVAHDIANPLAVILGEVQMLIMEETIDQQHIEEHCRLIEQHARKIHRLLQSIRTFARKSTGEPQPTDVHQPIEESLILVGKLLSTHQITVIRDDTTDLPLVMADPNHLEQVFMNLFQNAAQAMPDGGTITIITRHHPPPGKGDKETRAWRESPVVGWETPVGSQLSGTQRKRQGDKEGEDDPSVSPSPPLLVGGGESGNGWVEVSVTDTGPGIPHEHLDKVFDAFFTTKPPGQGTGLGLAICRRIVQEHGGDIRVHSETGKGACFTVLLPAVVEEKSTGGGQL